MSVAVPITSTPAVPAVSVDPSHVVVVLPEHHTADHTTVASELAKHTCGPYAPYPLYPVRGGGPFRSRRHAPGLWDVVRRPDGITVAAGGPRHRLDLQALAHGAGWAAQHRWQAWKTYIAPGTAWAQDWDTVLARSTHQRAGTRATSFDEALARFEAQPRVLAMIALNGQRVLPFPLDPGELAAFQAGELVYCTLAAQQSVVGQMLVLPTGAIYRPASPSIADRLRYLRAALDIVHVLHPDQHLAAVLRTPI